LAVEDGARAWVINASGTVVGFHDSFAQAIQKTPKLDARNKRSSDDYAVAQVSRFTSWLVRPILRRFVGEVPTSFREEGAPSAAVIDKSLMGVAQLWQRPSSDGRAQIVAAAQPIWSADNIVGVVIVEESTARAAALRLTALENQLAATFITLLATLLLFALFAAVLANRIRRLAKQTETAIDDHGRVVGRVSLDQRTDEIGQLSANIGNMLDRLRDYNAYLEALAGRLAHELRTPIAVVKSSIENLKYEQPAVAQSVYVTRSQEGIERLSKMVSRLTESSRLERMLSQSEFESTDLVALLKGCVEGYNLAAQARQGEGQAPIERVRFQSSEEQLKHAVVSDAICQLLDKLVDNAQRFAPVDLPVLVLLTTQDDQKPSRASDLRSKSSRFVLKIVNAGPHIPDAVMRNLFRSFSAGFAGGSQVESTDHNRDQSIGKVQSGQGTQSTASPQDNEVHLGLGLYIVRIVAEYHNARLKVSNLSADEIRAVSSVYAQANGGVSFAVEFV
jgi:two-component system, OmpR family, sensor histidine kinase ChvG